MLTRFYFPAKLDEALAVLRKQKRLDQIGATEAHTFFGYTDRDIVVSHVSQNAEHFGEEICLIVVDFPKTVVNELLMGDMTNFGQCAVWRSDHIMELDAMAEGLITHQAHFSLELVQI